MCPYCLLKTFTRHVAKWTLEAYLEHCGTWTVLRMWTSQKLIFEKLQVLSQMILQQELSFTVNSLMSAGINVCVFEAKQSSRGLIFVVSSCLFSYLGTSIMFVGIYFCNLKVVAKFAK